MKEKMQKEGEGRWGAASRRLQGAPALSDAGRDHLDGGGARSLTVNTGRLSHGRRPGKRFKQALGVF